jgi:DNA-binding MarR family transcriptional regulator
MSYRSDFFFGHFLGYWIVIAGLRYKGEVWRSLKPFKVTPEQWVVLYRLSMDSGISQKELADSIFKDQPNTTRILDKMAQKGLIRRDPNPSDRRSFLVFLTAKGKKLREELLPVVRQLRSKAMAGFSEAEMKLTKELIQRFLANLD